MWFGWPEVNEGRIRGVSSHHLNARLRILVQTYAQVVLQVKNQMARFLDLGQKYRSSRSKFTDGNSL